MRGGAAECARVQIVGTVEKTALVNNVIEGKSREITWTNTNELCVTRPRACSRGHALLTGGVAYSLKEGYCGIKTGTTP